MRDRYDAKTLFNVENQFYKDNYPALKEKYLHKVVAIYQNQVLGAYDNAYDACIESFKTHKPGTVCCKSVEEIPEYEMHLRSGFARLL